MKQKLLKEIYNKIPFKRPAIEFIKKNFNLPRKYYHFLRFKGQFEVKLRDRKFLIYNHSDQLENDIFWKGIENGWEKESIKIWSELVLRSKVILDIGANTGIYSLVAKCLNSNSRVYAFEPVARVYEKLIHNQKINLYDTQCFDFALSNYNGTATIFDQNTDHVYSVTVNKDRSDNPRKSIPVKINTKRLDTFIEEHELAQIDLIKLDVETHEPEVLIGMGKYLAQFEPIILIEILDDTIGEEVEKLVKDISYLFFEIDEEKGITQVDKLNKSASWNYLLCKKKTALSLGLIS